MALAWDEQSGILLSKLYPLVDEIQNGLREKKYGDSIDHVWTVLTCRARDFKQRKAFKKEAKRLEYEILLDFFLIKNVEMEQKKAIIQKQIVELTEKTLSAYKFEDFDKVTFLTDFKEIVASIVW